MSEELEALRARAAALGPEDGNEAVAVNEAILLLVEGDLLAARRLALALIKLGELDRAEEVVEEALTRHPDDPTMSARAADIASARRWAAKGAATTRQKRSPVARVASTWIKAVHHLGGHWGVRPGEEMWLSDPGQRDADGNRLYTAAGEPWGRPSWRVGEQAGVYPGGTQRVPVLVEIIAPPSFEPAFVQAADWAKGDDGERWPWVTWVRVLKSVPLEAAPTLQQLGIVTTSLQKRARLRTNPEIHGRLVRALEEAP